MTNGSKTPAQVGASPDTRVLPRVHPTVVHMLAQAAERAGDAEALGCGEKRLTYAQYLRCVAGFARELVGLGARIIVEYGGQSIGFPMGIGRSAIALRNALVLD